MNTIVYLFFTLVFSIIYWLVTKRSKKQIKEILLCKKLSFPTREAWFPNFCEGVCVYSSDLQSISKASTTVSIDNPINVGGIFFKEKRPTFSISLALSCKTPCFYAYSKSSGFKHAGINFSKPYLLNTTKYYVYGLVTDLIEPFLKKYNFEYFYCSYLPSSAIGNDLKTSRVEIKADCDSVTNEFLNDFIVIFKEIRQENENKEKRILKEFNVQRQREITYEKQGTIKKMFLEASQMNKTTH